MSLDNSEIPKFFEDMENETKQLKHLLLRLCWYMRGGLTLNEAYQLPPQDRDIINKIVEENVENTKKAGMPLI